MENYKEILPKKIGYKKSTLQKINNSHIIIGLFMDGILIFNFRTKNVVKSVEIRNNISHIIVSDMKYYHGYYYHYYFVEKRRINGGEIILYFVENIIEQKNEFDKINFIIKKKKENSLSTKSNIIDFIFMDFYNNENIYNNHIILADMSGYIYSN